MPTSTTTRETTLTSENHPNSFTKRRINTIGGPRHYPAVELDVTDAENIQVAFAAALERFGRIDVVVNNAGYGLADPFEELSDAQIKTQMDVNFFGLIAVTKKAMEVMRDQEPSGGLIQQVTSIGGQRGYAILLNKNGAYADKCLTKFRPSPFTVQASGPWRGSPIAVLMNKPS